MARKSGARVTNSAPAVSEVKTQKSINNRGRMVVMGGHLTDLKNTANNRSESCLI